MISIPRTPPDFAHPKLKVIGVGGAGSNALDRLVLDGLAGAEIVAINTDLQALAGSVAPRRVHIGQGITRGLGTGGDPEIGRNAAEDCADELREVVSDATIVFVLAGLGGGTGSGALPVIADLAREQNAFVVVLGTLPFSFEGKRRAAQASEALDAVRGLADLVICFENDRIGNLVPPDSSVHTAFASADQTLSECVRAMAGMVHRRGLLRVGFDEISSALRAEARSYFGYGEAQGDNRAYEALEAALKSPLLDHGRALKHAHTAVVQIVGGDDFTLNELSLTMDQVNKKLGEATRLYFGTAADSAMTGKLSIAIFCGSGAEEAPVAALEMPPAQEPEPIAPLQEEKEEPVFAEEECEPVAAAVEELEEVEEENPEPVMAEQEELLEEEMEPAPVPPTPRHPIFARLDAMRRADAESEALAPVAKPAKKTREEKQEQMQFEPVNRGRFEKSEPTIVDGQDLDVPTFMRRKIR